MQALLSGLKNAKTFQTEKRDTFKENKLLSYIHAFHAGNHADILKHLTISLILEHLQAKQKPFTVFDSHSGSGLYDLYDERLQKTSEADSGINRLEAYLKKNSSSPLNQKLSVFLNVLEPYIAQNKYPGSPLIENHFLREGDIQILSELHPQVIEELKENTRNCSVPPQIHRRDGYEMLEALTPPSIKRGVAIIDPSFEDKSDFAKCAATIKKLHKKWPVGIIALWYPLVSHRSIEISEMKEIIASAVDSAEPKILDVQLEVKKSDEMTGLASLYGSGMYILNFPYRLDEQLKEILPELSKVLGQSNSEWSVKAR